MLRAFARMKGGELYVPMIPSMRVVDLAEAVAPGTPLRTIGIRPGEKLHEVMITEDDARHTIELDDRYVVQPALGWWNPEAYLRKGRPVGETFRYASNINTEWLDAAGLERMMATVG